MEEARLVGRGYPSPPTSIFLAGIVFVNVLLERGIAPDSLLTSLFVSFSYYNATKHAFLRHLIGCPITTLVTENLELNARI